MPSSMPRCQVLMEPDVYAQMKLLAKYDRRTLSAMCATLIQTALELPRYQSLLAEARVALGEEVVKPDPRKARKQEHRPAVDVVPANPVERITSEIKDERDAMERPTHKPMVDHKGFLMKDRYGNVIMDSPEGAEITTGADSKISELKELLGALEALKA